MSEPHHTSTTAAPESHDDHPVDFKTYTRRCAAVLGAALVFVALMIWTSYLPQVGWPTKVTIILVMASCNAFIVAGFLMHLLSERKMVYTILGFTVSFVIGLFALTIYAMNDFPRNTVIH